MRKAKLILSALLILSSLVLAAVSHACAPFRPGEPAACKRPRPDPQTVVAPQPLAVPGSVKDVDLVIALDTSGSMDGLIDSARQKLWDVVTLLGRAQPQPRLRVGLITYGGTSGYDSERGWVRVDSPLTTDLDGIYAKLFALHTSGGDEYVARAIDVATDQMQWSNRQGALKILFVAGNERADQDPKIPLKSAVSAARQHGIYVNTIFCGSNGGSEAALWSQVASLGSGRFAAIDHNRIVSVATPMDAELARLSAELNRTYVAYGSGGAARAENQLAQDRNAEAASPSAAAGRASAKASAAYSAGDWDLVDAVKKEKKDVGKMAPAELPAPMRSMSEDERRTFVEHKAAERGKIQRRIAELSRQRDDFITTARRKAASAPAGMDDAMTGAVRAQGSKAGLSF